MIEPSRPASRIEGRSIALIVTVVLHLALLVISDLMHLNEPPHGDITVELSFSSVPPAEIPSRFDRQNRAPTAKAADQAVPSPRVPIRSQNDIPQQTLPAPKIVDPIQTEEPVDNKSLNRPPEMNFRRILERELTPEQAWQLLTKLLAEHPEFRETVLREMIAGKGFVPDSLPPVNLQLARIFKNGIQPTWESQRGAIEEAFKSFDPVQGWTNKGGYGPQLNVIGLINFLLKLIEGK
ncbi:MAG: hypothetical protein WC824_11905 [Bacteroidota bacterium]|jgi:hypothetical protein